MSRTMAWVVLVVWVLVGPLAMAFGACAAMGAMCEGPCAAGVCAPVVARSPVILQYVATVSLAMGDGAPSVSPRLVEPPPKSPLLSA